jgi:hypothetical protein
MIDSISKASYFSNHAPVLGVCIAEECYYTSYTLVDSRRKDLRCINSEVISLHSGSRYVVGDITPKGPVRQHTEAKTLAILTEMSSQPQKKKPKTSHTR